MLFLFKFGKKMKTLFDSSGGGISASETQLHIGLLLWPRYSLLALSGLLEALRYATKAQKKKHSKSVYSASSLITLLPAAPG